MHELGKISIRTVYLRTEIQTQDHWNTETAKFREARRLLGPNGTHNDTQIATDFEGIKLAIGRRN
jgi:hypothetical protein